MKNIAHTIFINLEFKESKNRQTIYSIKHFYWWDVCFK